MKHNFAAFQVPDMINKSELCSSNRCVSSTISKNHIFPLEDKCDMSLTSEVKRSISPFHYYGILYYRMKESLYMIVMLFIKTEHSIAIKIIMCG